MNANLFNSVIVAPLTALIGIYPYFRRPNKSTLYFALANGALAVWNLAELVSMMSLDHQTGLFVFRLSYVAGILLVPFYFQFIFAFIEVDVKTVRTFWNGIVGGAILLISICLTPLLVANIELSAVQPIKQIQGPLYPLFILYMLAPLGYALYRLFGKYQLVGGHQRIQYKYLFAALSVGFVEVALFFVSVCYFNTPTYYYYLQIVYALIIAYAILAHRLMDINVIIQKTLIYSVVTGALTGIYLVVATQLTKLLEGAGGKASFLSSAIAAVVVTLLFNPLLNKVRSFMDEKFFGNWLRDMSRGVVHEVKRPLAGISLPAQLTLLELEDVEQGKRSFESFLPELKERLQGIVRNTMVAGERIEALYAMSESNGNGGQPVNMDRVIDASLAALKMGLDQTSISLTLDVANSLPPVRGDAKQLEIVFVNLIKNAVEAMAENVPNARRLALAAGEDGHFVRVSVRDSGPGLSAADRERIFEAHFTTKGSQGMGIGLYLTEKIVREHGGSIDVKSESGKGTEFIVRLPKAA